MTKRYEWYQKKHFLIVSEVNEFRLQLTKMLESFGVRRIQTAKDLSTAQELYLRQQPHFVICDYHFSNDSDGLQLLRQLQEQGHYKYRSAFIICCAERSADFVKASLLHSPDEIWHPPLQKVEVRRQLDNLMVKKAALRHIEEALDKFDYQQAVKLAQEKLGRVPKLALQCLRMMALAFIRQSNASSALQVYERVLNNAEHSWAHLGRAVCQQELGHFLDCIDSCELVLRKHAYCTDAYLLKAEALEQVGELQQAAEALSRAADISKNNTQVLRRLGRLALRLRDMQTFTSSFRRLIAVADANPAVQLRPDDLVNYARSLFAGFLSHGPVKGKRFLNDLQEVLKRQQRHFADQPQIALAFQLIFARMMAAQQQPDKASSLIDEVIEHCLSLHPELLLREEAELTYEACPDIQAAAQLHQQVNRGETVLYPVKPDAERGQSLNREGMALFQKNQLTAAKQRFVDAFRFAPDNVSIALNLLQTLLKLMEQQGRNDDDIDSCRRCILAAQSLPQADNRRGHLDVLTIKLNDIRYRQQEDTANV